MVKVIYQRKAFPLLILLLAVISFVGCSQKQFSGNFSRRLTDTQNEWHFRYRGYYDPQASQRASAVIVTPPLDPQEIQVIMNQLVHVSPLRGYPVRVNIVQDAKPNAFTDGSQNIFITTGLLKIFDRNDDVIASVLAHELGHIIGHHIRDKKSRVSLWEYASYLTPALSILPYGGLYSGAAGTAMREGAKMEMFSYDRMQENEADAISAFLTHQTGYQGLGLTEFLDVAKNSGFGPPKTVIVPTSMSAVPTSVAVALLSSSPLYRIHPPSESRKKLVRVMQGLCEGWIQPSMLSSNHRWLADLYQTMQQRSPKN